MNILLTGGAGYIGSHTAVELLAAGHDVVIVDNFRNSSMESIRRIRRLGGRDVAFYEADAMDPAALDRVFREQKPDGVIHFAGLKAVAESVAEPLLYYRNNLVSALTVLDAMKAHGVKCIEFSSSATVYGTPAAVPITEDMPVGGCANPYGRTKYMIEQIMMDAAAADSALSVVLLRYFNPIGAHPSGLIGEDPKGIPNNLMPYITQVAVGKRERLSVFGDDYPTKDGTGVRDYIHVVDLALGHIAALEYAMGRPGVEVFNLGTGKGQSVLDVVRAFEAASGQTIPYAIAPRRPGDIAECYADPARAEQVLGWKTKYDLMDMCRDSWNFQRNNPDGYLGF